MRGRPKKTKAEHDLHGNPGGRKHEPEGVNMSNYRYKVPTYLRGEQKKYANEVADSLYRSGKSRIEYQDTFDSWCDHRLFRIQAAEVLREQGLFVEDERGILRKNKFITTHKEYSTSTLKHAEHLGISGLTADRVKGSPRKKNDPLDEYQKKGKKIGVVK